VGLGPFGGGLQPQKPPPPGSAPACLSEGHQKALFSLAYKVLGMNIISTDPVPQCQTMVTYGYDDLYQKDAYQLAEKKARAG
jgi:hypothetical protein